MQNLYNKSKKISLIKIASILFIASLVILFIGAREKESNRGSIFIAKLDDAIINPISSLYIKRVIKQAEKEGAECVVIELDTPGGLLVSTREIIKAIVNSQIPIVVYVAPRGARAGSAGFFITLASHIAAMAPMTNIGAAHPIDLMPGSSPPQEKQDEDKKVVEKLKEAIAPKEGDTLTTATKTISRKASQEPKSILDEKVLNDTIAWVKTIAKERGRNIDFAIDAVVNSASITETEALSKNVIDFIANDLSDLIQKLDGRKVKLPSREIELHTKNKDVIVVSFKWSDRILNVIANPNIAYILMLLGTLGLIFEVTHPGIAVPGVIGAICMILGLFALSTLPVNFAGLLLMGLSIILFIAEVKVVSYGLLTLGGIICFFLGSIMLFDTSTPELQISRPLIYFFTTLFCGVLLFLFTIVVRARSRKPLTGQSGMLGLRARAVSNLDPEGNVFVHGEIWLAKSFDGTAIPQNATVEIVAVEALCLKVKKAD